MKNKILVVRKMSALEYYYKGSHENPLLHEGHANNTRCLQKIEEILKANNHKYDVVTRKELSEDLVQNYDSVISAGGDGTAIALAAYNKNKYQLNLRSDVHSIGALCYKNIEDAMKYFLAGEYKIDLWTRQEIYLNGKSVGRALNELCIGEGLKFSKLAKYDIAFSELRTSEIKKESQSSSGLIIVTGTGSTAWPSAFKPFSRDNLYFEFRNLLMHSGNIEQCLSSNLAITYRGHEGKFAIDTAEFDFPRDSQLEIEISKFPLLAVSIKGVN